MIRPARASTTCWSAIAPATCGRRKIEQTEALKLEARVFRRVHCQRQNADSTTAHAGLRVVKMLEAADKSIEKRGRTIVQL